MTEEKILSPLTLVVTAVFTALVCVATMTISIYVPATYGYFNIGESVIFLSAILFGPFVGAFAGGVGSALADLLLGYWVYAPGTLVIKACEGAVVGILIKRSPKFGSKLYWRLLTVILGITIGFLLGWIGTTYYSGEVELTLGSSLLMLYIPVEFWLFLGVVAAFAMPMLGLLADPEFGWIIFSVSSGGIVMVLGYFLYQMFIIYPLFSIEVVAILEIPINIGQMVVGATVALPITKVILRAVPYLKQKQI
ncbi:MAG: ECF transporter S component [Candidatus Bathyarchaeia archaeon]